MWKKKKQEPKEESNNLVLFELLSATGIAFTANITESSVNKIFSTLEGKPKVVSFILDKDGEIPYFFTCDSILQAYKTFNTEKHKQFFVFYPSTITGFSVSKGS